MKPNREFIWKDLLVVACLAFAIARWDDNFFLGSFWSLLFVVLLVKQAYNHYTYYKATKKYY